MVYPDGVMRDDLVEAFVEWRKLRVDRFVQEPVHIQLDELIFVFVGDRNLRATLFEIYQLLHSKVVVASAESKIHRFNFVRLLDVS